MISTKMFESFLAVFITAVGCFLVLNVVWFIPKLRIKL